MKKPIRDEVIDTIFLAVLYAILTIACIIASENSNAQTRGELVQKIRTSAIHHGVDPDLAVAIAEVESGLNPHAVGSMGEIGVFQLRPEFHPVSRKSQTHNIDVALRYLARLQHECSMYGDAYFVCFNYGQARKLKYPRLFPYYRKVKAMQAKRERLKDAIAARD